MSSPGSLSAYRDGRRLAMTPNRRSANQSAGHRLRLTTIMEAVVERGDRDRYANPWLHDCRKDGARPKSSSTAATQRALTTHHLRTSCRQAIQRSPIIVVVDSPRTNGTTGGVVAAPIFKNIAEAALRHLGVAAEHRSGTTILVVRFEGIAGRDGDRLIRLPAVLSLSILRRARCPICVE